MADPATRDFRVLSMGAASDEEDNAEFSAVTLADSLDAWCMSRGMLMPHQRKVGFSA
jgi:hypothetical protein